MILRLQCVSLKAESPSFQSSTQYGEEKRYYNDDIVFKVGTMNSIKSLTIKGCVRVCVSNHACLERKSKEKKVLR